ncbi:MAG TPA: hypothetical protein VFN94_07465 [Nitrospiria bacterium]|nr:hypothetical protein [Nitrospiria bacterium]
MTIGFALPAVPTVSADHGSAAPSDGIDAHAAEASEGMEPSCHGTSHDVGAAIAERAATLTEAMVACSDRCTFGCVHGAFRAYFSKRLGRAGATAVAPDVAQEISDLCREDSTVLPGFYRGNCAHSVGHAFAAVASDAPGAAAWCRVFEPGEMRFYCETGVFMEARRDIRAGIIRERMSFAARAKAGVDYCSVHASAPGACLRFVWPWAEDADDARVLVRACGRMDGQARRGCVYAAGYVSRQYLTRHPADAGRVCGAAEPADRVYCAAGLALMKKDHHARAALPALCRGFDDRDLRAACDDQASRFYYQLDNPLIAATLPE